MRLLTILFACATLAFAGCASTETNADTGMDATTDAAEAVTVVNTKCPISGEELDNDSPSVALNGYAIGVCCNNCAAEVEAWSDEKKDTFVQTALDSQ